jgi:hypothetical protein
MHPWMFASVVAIGLFLATSVPARATEIVVNTAADPNGGNPTSVQFTVSAPSRAQPTTAAFTVTDACGAWTSFAGGGAGSF